jgi:hypothetical protein
MAGGIFLLDSEGGLTEMAETAFAAEVDLQKLLAQHPGLRPGDQIDPESPRRWLSTRHYPLINSGQRNKTSTPFRLRAFRCSHQSVSEALRMRGCSSLATATATNF